MDENAATCDILHLEPGPLDLNLLGLEVHLNRVVLDIDADPTGGLLCALLCAVANLPGVGGPLTAVVGPLRQIPALRYSRPGRLYEGDERGRPSALLFVPRAVRSYIFFVR